MSVSDAPPRFDKPDSKKGLPQQRLSCVRSKKFTEFKTINGCL